MNPTDLESLLGRVGIDDYVTSVSEVHLVNRLEAQPPVVPAAEEIRDLNARARMLEAQAVGLVYAEGLGSGRAKARFAQAFACWRLLSESGQFQPQDDIPLEADLDLPFRLAVSGIFAEKAAEVRLGLRDLLPSAPQLAAQVMETRDEDADWERVLSRTIASALLLLTRKADGWSDVGVALSLLQGLRAQQAEMEGRYLDAQAEDLQVRAALRLVGAYHVAQLATTTGSFLERGRPGLEAITPRLNRHHDQATEAFSQTGGPGYSTWAELVWILCRQLVSNSIWSHVEVLGDRVRQFVAQLTSETRDDPILELWPSQQQAMRENLFDPYRRAVLVQMPTSGGKTLLAKFSIVQSLALNPDSPVVYVVPTRALVNQVTRDLRRDLGPLNYAVEQTVPAFEMDPSEETLLRQRPNVLVTTPEKLDLLVRVDHPCTQDMSLLVLDEAHGLAESTRGARLELLLSTVRRDRPGARFLLLSPFLPNGDQLVDWLGGGVGLPPIYVDWKPSSRVVALLTTDGRTPKRRLTLRTLDAAGNADIGADKRIDLGPVETKPTSIKATTALGVARLRSRGTTLVLTAGKATAISRALELAEEAPAAGNNELLSSAISLVDLELGVGNSLSNCLRQGVAYHHAGLSQETRIVIEGLLSNGLLHTICGTSTLAQGVNFPISQVFIETKRKGRDSQLTYADLWNVAGRAGRALKDDVGLVAFPAVTAAQADEWQAFLRGEATEIASQLTHLIDQADQIGETFNMGSVRLNEGLGELLQYLAHALRVSGSGATAAEVEDLLRSSLVFHQASADHPERASRLVRLCRAYIDSISNRPGLLSVADSTGFATPSVLNLLARTADEPELRDARDWQPQVLFGDDLDYLASRISLIAELPEMNLGQGEQGTFSPKRVARILQAWVRGQSLPDMASEFGSGDDPDKRAADFSSYLYGGLLGRASWGLGALEAVCFAGRDAGRGQEGYVPSMIYFGVDTQEAVWLRMAGVPREAARGAAQLWSAQVRRQPESFRQIREWVSSLSDADWDTAVRSQGMPGEDMRRVWDAFLA